MAKPPPDSGPGLHSDEEVIDAWIANASTWAKVVRTHQIESRRLVTDAAIMQTVLARQPRTVLDLGCGEGWLVRALEAHGIVGTGVDAVPELVDQATQAGGGSFAVASYETIADGALSCSADVVVANFSLLGGHAVQRLVQRVPFLMEAGGFFVVQTLHPVVACGELPYEDGWREGTWSGFGNEFKQPAPWYFRTVGSWLAMLTDAGMRVVELMEPLHPTTKKPASIIFVAERDAFDDSQTNFDERG